MNVDPFSVDTAALRAFADQLDQLADESGADGPAAAYTQAGLTLEWVDTAVLFSGARGAIHEARDVIVAMLGSQARALRASANELRATAHDYDATDQRMAAALDRFFFGGAGPETSPGADVPVCYADVSSVLAEPERSAPRDLASDILSTDWFSPTADLRQILDWVFDYDPVAEVHRGFTGDWHALYACASVCDNLADFERRTGAEVNRALWYCLDRWTGGAANAAAEYFNGLTGVCEANTNALARLAERCNDTARSMEDAADLLAGLLGSILDISIAGLAAYVTAVALSETVVGGVIGFLIGTGAIGNAIWLANQAWDVIQETQTYLTVLTTAVGVLTASTAGGASFALPAAYNTPMVR
jgi:uncharacterized protein YukE